MWEGEYTRVRMFSGDFDLCEDEAESECRGSCNGTVWFRAPECFLEKEATIANLEHKRQVDMWGVGVTLYVWMFRALPSYFHPNPLVIYPPDVYSVSQYPLISLSIVRSLEETFWNSTSSRLKKWSTHTKRQLKITWRCGWAQPFSGISYSQILMNGGLRNKQKWEQSNQQCTHFLHPDFHHDRLIAFSMIVPIERNIWLLRHSWNISYLVSIQAADGTRPFINMSTQ